MFGKRRGAASSKPQKEVASKRSDLESDDEAPAPPPSAPKAPFTPHKATFYDRQLVDYIKTSTNANVWYYRCAALWGAICGRQHCGRTCAGSRGVATPLPASPHLVRRRDRLSVPRGPCSVPVLREAWVQGIVDENTLVWGSGLIDWLPIRNVRTLVPQIRTVEGEQPRAAARRRHRDLARLQPRHAQGPRPACARRAARRAAAIAHPASRSLRPATPQSNWPPGSRRRLPSSPRSKTRASSGQRTAVSARHRSTTCTEPLAPAGVSLAPLPASCPTPFFFSPWHARCNMHP